jgi:hypothetical protein
MASRRCEPSERRLLERQNPPSSDLVNQLANARGNSIATTNVILVYGSSPVYLPKKNSPSSYKEASQYTNTIRAGHEAALRKIRPKGG